MPSLLMNNSKRRLVAACAAAALSALAGGAAAQAAAYPTKPITVVIGYAPGGSVDAVVRAIAPKLGEALGQPIVVDYKPGASGMIGAKAAAGAKADGYTLHLVESATLVILPSMRDVGYSPTASFTPISTVASAGMLVAVNKQVPAKTLPELLGVMKSKAGGASYATSGVGSVGHVLFEKIKIDAKVDAVHVAYKGGGQAMTDLIGGQVPIISSSLAPALPQVKAQTIQPIGITSLTRNPALPDVPTIAEQGYPGFEALAWYAMVGPAQLPPDIVAKVGDAIRFALKSPEVKETLMKQGMVSVGDQPADLSRRIQTDLNQWKSVVEQAKITLD
jgi:tripartite-type tricarboxylate transporter receptor subunit TctC